jgi:hypothetical protein
METLVSNMAQTQIIGYRKCEVDIRRCQVDVGSSVTPETIVGWHYETGQPIKAGLRGQVATIYFNPMHDSFMIMIVGDRNSN